MNKKYIKLAIKIFISLVIIGGLTFFVDSYIKTRKALVFTAQKTMAVIQFLQQNFPDKVAAFDARKSLEAKNTGN